MTIEKINQEYPEDSWIYININSAEDVHNFIVKAVFETGKTIYGQSVWLSGDKGFLLISKENLDKDVLDFINKNKNKNKNLCKLEPNLKWYQKFFNLFKNFAK